MGAHAHTQMHSTIDCAEPTPGVGGRGGGVTRDALGGPHMCSYVACWEYVPATHAAVLLAMTSSTEPKAASGVREMVIAEARLAV